MELKLTKDTFYSVIFLAIIKVLEQLFIILLAALFLFGSPFLFIPLLPVYLYRYVLGHLIHSFNPNFGKLLSARATIFAQDDLYTQPKFTILTGSLLNGNLDFKLMKESIRANLLDKKLATGESRFQELQQYIISWGGFMFWKTDKEFNIDNHVEIFSPEKETSLNLLKTDRYDDADMRKVAQHLIEKPWVKGRPVWNFVLVNNYFPNNANDSAPRSMMFLRCHHTLVDGFSLQNLLSEAVFGITAEEVKRKMKSFMESVNVPKVPIWYYFVLPFACAFDAATLIIQVFQRAPWRPSEKDQTGKFHMRYGNAVPLKNLKLIKSHFKVSFSSVTTAVICGAIREMMMKKGVRPPQNMLSAVALPLPRGHTKLRNIMTGSYATMPLVEFDPIKRLLFCSEDYKRLKRSTVPLQTHWAFTCMGSLFNPWCKLVSRNRYVPLVMSNFIGGEDHFYACGHKMEDGFFAVGPQLGSVGLSFWIGSYVDQIRISVVAEASVLSGDETMELASEIVKQIDILLQFVHV